MLPKSLARRQATSEIHDTTMAATIAQLLAAVAAIPRDELPDGDARQALADAVRAGDVIGVYKPHTYPLHNIELRDVPRDIDPRVSCADWQRWFLGGLDPAEATIAEQRARQAAAQVTAQAAAGQAQTAEPTAEPTERGGQPR